MLASVFVNPAEKPGGCPMRPAIYYVSSDLSSKEEGGGDRWEEGWLLGGHFSILPR